MTCNLLLFLYTDVLQPLKKHGHQHQYHAAYHGQIVLEACQFTTHVQTQQYR